MKLEEELKKSFFNKVRRKASCFALATSLAFLTSCMPYHHKPRVEFQRPYQEIPCFDYEKKEIKPSITFEEETREYVVEKIRFPSLMHTNPKNDTVTAYYYKPKDGKKHAAIVVLPIMGGSYFFSEYFAKAFAKNDFAVLRFERKGKLFDKNQENMFEYTTKVVKQTIIDVRRGLDWLETQPEVDKDKIGVEGVSLGAVISYLLAEADSRIKAGAFLLGGGDLAAILSTTNEPEIVNHRERIMKKNNWTLEQFREVCASYTDEIDPLAYAHLVDPSKMLMMNGYFDKVVLMNTAEKLWEAMGKPDFEKMFCGHYTAALYLPYAKSRAVQHFKEKLLGIKPNNLEKNEIDY